MPPGQTCWSRKGIQSRKKRRSTQTAAVSHSDHNCGRVLAREPGSLVLASRSLVSELLVVRQESKASRSRVSAALATVACVELDDDPPISGWRRARDIEIVPILSAGIPPWAALADTRSAERYPRLP